MPRGQVTALPEDWLPLKTPHGWTAVRLREDATSGVIGCDMPRTPDGKQIAFWRRRREVAEALAGWAILSQNEALRRENERLTALLNSLPARTLQEAVS